MELGKKSRWQIHSISEIRAPSTIFSKAQLTLLSSFFRGLMEAPFGVGMDAPICRAGWAENVIGKYTHRAHAEFALRFQVAAGQPGIPVEEGHRIGDLPYLPSKS